MSRFSQRWRTQRNAIRNANCRICESSNFWTQIALPGTPGSMPVSVSVDTTRKSSFLSEVLYGGLWCLRFWSHAFKYVDIHSPHQYSTFQCGREQGGCFGKKTKLTSRRCVVRYEWEWKINGMSWKICSESIFINWTWNQARGPAEFKHITKRRKRN